MRKLQKTTTCLSNNQQHQPDVSKNAAQPTSETTADTADNAATTTATADNAENTSLAAAVRRSERAPAPITPFSPPVSLVSPGSSSKKKPKSDADLKDFLDSCEIEYDLPSKDTEEASQLVHCVPEIADETSSYIAVAKQYVKLEETHVQRLYLVQKHLGEVCDKALAQIKGTSKPALTLGKSSEFVAFCKEIGKSESRIMKYYIPFHRFLEDFPRMKYVKNKSMTALCDMISSIRTYLKKPSAIAAAQYWENVGISAEETNDTQCKAITFSTGERCQKGAPEGDFCKTHM